MKPVTFDISNDNPTTKELVEWGSFIVCLRRNPMGTVTLNGYNDHLTGWVPYRILEEWQIVEKGTVNALYRLLEVDLLLENIYPQLTPSHTPVNGVQLERKTVQELARIYDCCTQKKMLSYLHRYFVTMRNLFWGAFGEDAHLWWEYCQVQLCNLREKKLPVDRMLLVLGVVMCELHHRKGERRWYEMQMSEAQIVTKSLESMQKKFRKRDITRLGLWKELRNLYQSATDMKEAVRRHHFKEPESLSPLMHLVNLWIVDCFLEAGYHQNEACRDATALYLGFDFFPDPSARKPFCFKDAKDDKRRVEAEIDLRADRIRKHYAHWKKDRAKLLERLKHDYRRVFGDFEPSDEFIRSKLAKLGK